MQELTMASFPENTNERPLRLYDGPECQPEDECFKDSHVAPGGIFLTNTYLTRPDRKYIPAGAVRVREGTLCKNN